MKNARTNWLIGLLFLIINLACCRYDTTYGKIILVRNFSEDSLKVDIMSGQDVVDSKLIHSIFQDSLALSQLIRLENEKDNTQKHDIYYRISLLSGKLVSLCKDSCDNSRVNTVVDAIVEDFHCGEDYTERIIFLVSREAVLEAKDKQ
ncbi:MAG: hypothetical protein HC842_03280 [Cytophagales bacterium]|nr:hypothetical protein [Cytophagales bacterium]